MIAVPSDLLGRFQLALDQKRVPKQYQSHYKNWLRSAPFARSVLATCFLRLCLPLLPGIGLIDQYPGINRSGQVFNHSVTSAGISAISFLIRFRSASIYSSGLGGVYFSFPPSSASTAWEPANIEFHGLSPDPNDLDLS